MIVYARVMIVYAHVRIVYVRYRRTRVRFFGDETAALGKEETLCSTTKTGSCRRIRSWGNPLRNRIEEVFVLLSVFSLFSLSLSLCPTPVIHRRSRDLVLAFFGCGSRFLPYFIFGQDSRTGLELYNTFYFTFTSIERVVFLANDVNRAPLTHTSENDC
jgi:hypothetical protein